MTPKILNTTAQGNNTLRFTLRHSLENHKALYISYSLKTLKHRDGKATILDLNPQKATNSVM